MPTTHSTLPAAKMSTDNRHSVEARHPSSPILHPSQDRLDRLMPNLRRCAARLAQTANGDLAPDDVLQTMALVILEYGDHPGLGDGYYFNRARWYSLNLAEAARTYRGHYPLMPLAIEDDGEAVDYSEFVADPDPAANPEASLLAAERLAEIRARLKPSQRLLLDRLLDGYHKSEIADELGVSRTRVSNLLTEMRACLSDFATEQE